MVLDESIKCNLFWNIALGMEMKEYMGSLSKFIKLRSYYLEMLIIR